MPITKKPTVRPRPKLQRVRTKKSLPSAAALLRQNGEDWARHWNVGDLNELAAAYAEDAVYLPPHHKAVHGREAIRKYLRGPLVHGVTNLAFEVTYIKQSGPIAWDVGTYSMSVPAPDGTRHEDRGKYLSVWKRIGRKWLLAADAWSSDLPPMK